MSIVRKASTSRAIFLELVLDLLIFAVCAVICLQVFAHAYRESVRSTAISELGVEAQQIAEQFKAGNGQLSAIEAATYPNSYQDGDRVFLYYDQELNAAGADDAHFILSCEIDSSQPLKQAKIVLTEVIGGSSSQLFAFDVSSYQLASGTGAGTGVGAEASSGAGLGAGSGAGGGQ